VKNASVTAGSDVESVPDPLSLELPWLLDVDVFCPAGATRKFTPVTFTLPRLIRTAEGFAEVCWRPDGNTSRTM
jgi:hypothetical protein